MRLFISVFYILFFMGCSIKDYTMFQNDDPSLVKPQELNVTFQNKILPDDILSIDIYNMNQKSNLFKSQALVTSLSYADRNKYVVESDGTIYLPLLKDVYVQGLTTQDLNKKLTNKYAKYLRMPYVKTSIANHRVYVLGEVNKQGLVPIEGNTISLIEAISKAGGLTDYALLDRVRVISNVNGKSMLKTLDFRKLSALNIDNLMLANNSIVYVQPRSSKAIRLASEGYLSIIGDISSATSMFLSIDALSHTLFNPLKGN